MAIWDRPTGCMWLYFGDCIFIVYKNESNGVTVYLFTTLHLEMKDSPYATFSDEYELEDCSSDIQNPSMACLDTLIL